MCNGLWTLKTSKFSSFVTLDIVTTTTTLTGSRPVSPRTVSGTAACSVMPKRRKVSKPFLLQLQASFRLPFITRRIRSSKWLAVDNYDRDIENEICLLLQIESGEGLENIDAILEVQDYFLELADRHNVPIADNVSFDHTVLFIIRHVAEALRARREPDAVELP